MNRPRPWPLLVTMALAGGLASACRPVESKVSGRVTLQGSPPPEVQIKLDSVTAALRPEGMFSRHYAVCTNGGLPNVLVHITLAPAPLPTAPSPPLAVMEIRRGQTEPYVLAMQTNQTMAYRNKDPVLHNAHITPQPGSKNREVNYAFLPVTPPSLTSFTGFWNWIRGRHLKPNPRLESIQFPHPELFVRFKCDVHPWEFGYVCVLDHPYFAVTDADGRFELPNGLPPGRYVLEARHRKLGALTREFTLALGEHERIAFDFELPPKR